MDFNLHTDVYQFFAFVSLLLTKHVYYIFVNCLKENTNDVIVPQYRLKPSTVYIQHCQIKFI